MNPEPRAAAAELDARDRAVVWPTAGCRGVGLDVVEVVRAGQGPDDEPDVGVRRSAGRLPCRELLAAAALKGRHQDVNAEREHPGGEEERHPNCRWWREKQHHPGRVARNHEPARHDAGSTP